MTFTAFTPIKITQIEEIEGEPSRCLSVDSPTGLFTLGNSILTHNSVMERNIILAALMRPEAWTILGLDLKRVEITPFQRFGVDVAVTMEDCAITTKAIQSLMMSRYAIMEEHGVNDWADLKIPDKGGSVLLIIDEIGEMFDKIEGKSEEAEADRENQEIVRMCLSSIARLGRAAQVFMVAATQRPSADIIPMQIRDNLSTRIGCGQIPYNISRMLFSNERVGQKIQPSPRGRFGLQIHGRPLLVGQGLFIELADFLAKYKKKPKKKKPHQEEALKDVSYLRNHQAEKKKHERAENSWDEDMNDIFVLGEKERRARRPPLSKREN